jgi:hypothetical protein
MRVAGDAIGAKMLSLQHYSMFDLRHLPQLDKTEPERLFPRRQL